jgi:phosphoribosylanthranilate isomerase
MSKENIVKVKICGITNIEDARAAIKFGADCLGFIFDESPRQVDQDKVREIVSSLGPFISVAGVFVNSKLERILEISAFCGLDIIQLHGEETPDFCKRLAPYKVIKTFRMGELFSTKEPNKYDVKAYLFETDGSKKGGTGRTWAWEKLQVKKIKKPFIVTGGLTPMNVERAINILKPYAVDVSSGVEKSPGKKDHKLMEKFIRNAKNAKQT